VLVLAGADVSEEALAMLYERLLLLGFDAKQIEASLDVRHVMGLASFEAAEAAIFS
jgi:hypothetical protein